VSDNRDDHPCIFCAIPRARYLAENELAFALRDVNPVTPLHTLVLPKRHVEDFFTLGAVELEAVFRLINQCRDDISIGDEDVSGFNLGVNVGDVAGQTLAHTTVHLIPRRAGDADMPAGGVRCVIPAKQRY
jgi:diadenosine tetraphosphate (Ap4A) HIT family hydrolase